MTVVERAAYLKGLVSGLGVEPDSKDGKLWNALTELLSDMAHEIEDLTAANAELSEALDHVFVDLTTLEEMNLPLEKTSDEMSRYRAEQREQWERLEGLPEEITVETRAFAESSMTRRIL